MPAGRRDGVTAVPWRPLPVVALLAVSMAVGAGAPRLAGAWWPDGAPADLGVDLPPAAAGVAPPPAAAVTMPGVPVRCRLPSACLRWRLPPMPVRSPPPALAGDHLVVPTATGLLGYRIATGEQVWRTDLDGLAANRSVVRVADAGGHAVVADGSGRVVALDATSGEVRWQQPHGDLIAARAAQAVADGWHVALRVRGEEGLTSFVAAVSVDATTGAVRWRRVAANVALSRAGAVLQDVNGDLTGLAADGTDAWTLATGKPAAGLTTVGDVLLVGGRDDALLVDVASGEVLDEIVGSPSRVRADADAVVWPIVGGIAFRASDGHGWRTEVPGAVACCSGFVLDAASVTVLTGRGELIRLARADGAVVERGVPPQRLDADAGRVWLDGGVALSAVPGRSGLARLHDTYSGVHLADVTADARSLLRADDGTWIVLAPGFALTLDPPGGVANAQGRPVGAARTR